MAPEAGSSRLARLEAGKARRKEALEAEEVAWARSFLEQLGSELGLTAEELEDAKSLSDADIVDVAREMADCAPHLMVGQEPWAGEEETPRPAKPAATDVSTSDVEEEPPAKPAIPSAAAASGNLRARPEAPAPAGRCAPEGGPGERCPAASSSGRPAVSVRSCPMPRHVQAMLGEELMRLGAFEFAKDLGCEVGDCNADTDLNLGKQEAPEAADASGGGWRGERFRRQLEEQDLNSQVQEEPLLQDCIEICRRLMLRSEERREQEQYPTKKQAPTDVVEWVSAKSGAAPGRAKKKKARDSNQTIKHSLNEAQKFWELGICPPNTMLEVPVALVDLEDRLKELRAAAQPSAASPGAERGEAANAPPRPGGG